MKKSILFLLFIVAISVTFAQRQAVEISHYIFPEFTRGTVLMKSGYVYQASLNYNALSEEMIFEDKGQKLAIGKEEREKVDTVYIQNRRFFVLNDRFVELVYRSVYELYADYKCDVKLPGKPAPYGGTSETTAVSTYSGVYSDGVLYELKLPDEFIIRPYTVYWLKKDGETKRVLSVTQLTRMFGNRRDLARDYINTHKVDYDDQESLVMLMKYMDVN
jgi:hypothetical protein